MPKLDIKCQSNHSQEETFTRVKKFFDTDTTLAKFDSDLKTEFNDSAYSGSVIGRQFKAKLEVSGNAEVCINVDLPFHLALAKGMIQKTLQSKLDEALS